MTFNKITLAIAEDHEIFRKSLCEGLSQVEEFVILFSAEDGCDLIRQMKNYLPDIILMDISMPNIDGFEALEILNKEYPNSKIIVLSFFFDEYTIAQFMDAGARAFVTKASKWSELLVAIHAVHRNGIYTENIENLFPLKKSPTHDNRTPSQREVEVLKLLAENKTNNEIADLLEINVRTVEGHRQNLQKKLNLFNLAAVYKYIWGNYFTRKLFGRGKF